MNNRDFAQSDAEFREACKKAGIPPTQRQASKFRLKSGRAYQFRNGHSVDNAEDLGIQISAEQE